jgi:peptidyl-dipeptidase A
VTIHHELGHNYYQRAYNKQPTLYLNSANDGFHEAIGDMIALSITPDYLVQIGLLDADKVAELTRIPACCCVRRWTRWRSCPSACWSIAGAGMCSRAQRPRMATTRWTDLRLNIRGSAAVPRSEDAFDPGAKYHIPGNTPYTRYFLARLLQFQFYKAACDIAKWKGPLHRCSFYGNKDVGHAAECHARDGSLQTLARCIAGLYRQARDRWHRDDRLFQAADDVAEKGE